MTSYNIYTVAELKNIAREHGLAGYSRLRRDKLIALLQGVVPTVIPTVVPPITPIEPKIPQLAPESNILSIPPQPDIFYQLINHLTFSELKKLCSTSKEYSQLCQSKRFQPILKQKARQEKETLFNVDEILKSGKKFVYKLDNPERDFSIKYIGNNKFQIEELVPRIRGPNNISNDSLLSSLFPGRVWSMNSKGYLNISLIKGGDANEAEKFINYLRQQPNFDISRLTISRF